MGAHAVIRACVFHHLEMLRPIGQHLPALTLAAALNDVPGAWSHQFCELRNSYDRVA